MEYDVFLVSVFIIIQMKYNVKKVYNVFVGKGLQEPLTSDFAYVKIKKKYGFRFFLSIIGNVSNGWIFSDGGHEILIAGSYIEGEWEKVIAIKTMSGWE